MKILVINPNSDNETTRLLDEKAKSFISKGNEVETVQLKNTPKIILNRSEYVAAIDEMVELVKLDQHDAYIIACHADPNLEVLRSLTDKPVIGIGEASMRFAAIRGSGFAVLSPSPKVISNKREMAHKYHLSFFLRKIAVPTSERFEDMVAAARAAIIEEGVDSIVLGCANYVQYDVALERELQIPVYDGLVCALILAQGLSSYRHYKVNGGMTSGFTD